MSDSDWIRYSAEALKVFGDVFLPGRLPPLPSPTPPPVQAGSARFESGISIVGRLRESGQRHRLRIDPGETIAWLGATGAKLGMMGDNKDAWGANLPYHEPIPSLVSPFTFRTGDRVIVAKARSPVDPASACYLEEAVLIECVPEPTAPPLDSRWPSLVTGMTEADGDRFFNESDWIPETREGWAARHGRPVRNRDWAGEYGYGAKIAETVSLGALIMASTMNSVMKTGVQTRLLQMGDDLELFNVNYPADGGQGNGRLFPALVRQALRPSAASVFDLGRDFSENQQIVPYLGPGNIGGYGFSHHGVEPPSEVGQQSDYVGCCTASRWGGAALVTALCPWLWLSTNASTKWINYIKAYILYQEANATPEHRWFITKDDRCRELILNNRAVFGF